MEGGVAVKLDGPGGGVRAADDLGGNEGLELSGFTFVAEQTVIDGPLAPGNRVVVTGVRIEVADVLSAAIDEDVRVRLSADGSNARVRRQRRHDGIVTEPRRQGGGAGHLEESTAIDTLGAKSLVQVGDVPLPRVVECHD